MKKIVRKRKPMSKVNKISLTIISILFIIQLLSVMLPPIWMILTAFRDTIDYFIAEFGWPNPWVFDNFKTVLPLLNFSRYVTGVGIVNYSLFDMYKTSFIWSFGVAFVATFWYALCGYVFAKYKFPGKELLYGIGIFVMIAPIVGGLTSGLVVYKRLGVYDNMLVQILLGPGCSFSGGTFLIFYAMFKGIPWDYAEAGFIDGAGHVRVAIQLMFPHIAGFWFVQFLLAFLGQWNNYEIYMTMLPSYANLAYGMFLFQNDASSYGATPPQVMAGFLFVCIPTTIIYLCCSKVIITKATAGGLKG